MNPTDSILLANGREAPAAAIRTTMLALSKISDVNPIAFYEFVTACRDRSHVLFGNTADVLKGYALVESVRPDGTADISATVRDITVSAVTGDDFDMRIGSPLADVA